MAVLLGAVKSKNKVYLSKMRTDYGIIPVLSNFQRVNRNTKVYYANKNGESVFFIIRKKDADLLKSKGFKIQSIDVPKGQYAKAVGYSSGTKLEVSKY